MSHLSTQNALPSAMATAQTRMTQVPHMSPLKWLKFFVCSTSQFLAETACFCSRRDGAKSTV